MRYNFVYYSTDSSFDYGDFPGATHYQTDLHGFEIEIDKNDIPHLDTLQGFGDYDVEVEQNKSSYQQFYNWLVKSFAEIRTEDEEATPLEVLEELAEFIQDQIKKAA